MNDTACCDGITPPPFPRAYRYIPFSGLRADDQKSTLIVDGAPCTTYSRLSWQIAAEGASTSTGLLC